MLRRCTESSLSGLVVSNYVSVSFSLKVPLLSVWYNIIHRYMYLARIDSNGQNYYIQKSHVFGFGCMEIHQWHSTHTY